MNLAIDDYEDETYYTYTLSSLWCAVAHSKFTKVTLGACTTNLGNLIYSLTVALFTDVCKFSGLKVIELLGHDAGGNPIEDGCLSEHVNKLIPFLDWQGGLETLVIEGFDVEPEDIEEFHTLSQYEGFEQFYNYLPYLISKTSFKSLCVAACSIPINTFQSIISNFFKNPTSHKQNLEFENCNIVAESTETYSDDYPFIESVTTQCVSGEYKSLSIKVCVDGSLISSLHESFFEYTTLQLNQNKVDFTINLGVGTLSLQSVCEHEPNNKTQCFKPYG